VPLFRRFLKVGSGRWQIDIGTYKKIMTMIINNNYKFHLSLIIKKQDYHDQ